MYNKNMTIRKNKKSEENLVEIGNVIYKHRKRLSLEKSSRKFFLENREAIGLWDQEYITEKTLTNIELGKNLPSLTTLNYLATALEVDLIELVVEIEPFL